MLPRAAWSALKRRRRPADVRRILIAHNLLLGDTLMLTALLARLRARWPDASISMTVAPGVAPLYAGQPYGVQGLVFDPHRASTTRRIIQTGPYDLALVPGDNRYAWLARSAGARWVVALDEPGARLRNRLVDEFVSWPDTPGALADMFAALAGPDHGEVYDKAHWPAPICEPFELLETLPEALPKPPPARYCVLHVGAGSTLRHWPAPRWMALAQHLARQGLVPVWSGGKQEAGLIEAIDPHGEFASCAGRLSLAQLWHLVQGAVLLVVPDTGVAHLAKLTGTPTVCLFGPGSDVLFGAGRFWREHRFVAVIETDFPCRDQRTLFGRQIDWVRRCQRSAAQCAAPACMQALDLDRVISACRQLLEPV